MKTDKTYIREASVSDLNEILLTCKIIVMPPQFWFKEMIPPFKVSPFQNYIKNEERTVNIPIKVFHFHTYNKMVVKQIWVGIPFPEKLKVRLLLLKILHKE